MIERLIKSEMKILIESRVEELTQKQMLIVNLKSVSYIRLR